MGEKVKRYAKTTDFSYFAICVCLSIVSVLTLISVGRYAQLQLLGSLGDMRPAMTQILAAGCGVVAMVFVSLMDYRRLARCKALHIVCWALVLLTFVPFIGYAPPGTGSQSWIAMPLGMSFQPTEIAKISFMLSFAAHLAQVRDSLNKPRTILPVLCHLAIPVVLVQLQGDDGTALVFAVSGAVMLVAAGLNRWVVASIAAAGIVAAPFVWQYGLSEYQKERILGLIEPSKYADGIMYQQLQGAAAMQNGGIFGTGLFSEEHTYVPRAENDFIFSYFAESCGLVGGVLLIALLVFLAIKILRTAMQACEDMGSFLCVGVFAAMMFQTVVNLGMNLVLLPVMGVTLPFVSAGGTSSLMLYMSMGLVVAVNRRRKLNCLAENPAETAKGKWREFFL